MAELETLAPEVAALAAKLRVPFEGVQKVKKEWIDKKTGQPKSFTADYIGHAVVTDRLLSVDPTYVFEPLLDDHGVPIVVHEGLSGGDSVGVWGRLTILGSSVVEFCSGKDLLDAYGRCLCRAAMRRGVALDLWIKDDEFKQSPTGDGKAPVRQEGPGAFPVPKSWAKVQEAVKLVDNPEEAWALFEAYVRAASYHLYGETDSKKLEPDQRKMMLQKAAGAAAWLHDNVKHDAGTDFLFFDAAVQQAAWASMLEGVALEIPDYVPPASGEPDPDLDAERIAAEVFGE